MIRDALCIKGLLGMLPAYADGRGIGINDFLDNWMSSRRDAGSHPQEAAFFYLVNRCAESRFIFISRDWVIQITRSGNDFINPSPKLITLSS
ncbi:hypothetical protein [Pseudomonas syringae group genomosp. 3]|uniref:hypothetical protein n=1 Tax=Pseudomonas syringae group genomosp. 3 TaxID=251701 RepID=UPI0011C381B9|nr:hypothetical protein [Pseudomonas syringae group genomosp. 3]